MAGLFLEKLEQCPVCGKQLGQVEYDFQRCNSGHWDDLRGIFQHQSPQPADLPVTTEEATPMTEQEQIEVLTRALRGIARTARGALREQATAAQTQMMSNIHASAVAALDIAGQQVDRSPSNEATTVLASGSPEITKR